MRKVPTIFQRDWNGDRSRVLDAPNPACAWVFEGYGRATRKVDGTSCAVRDGALFKRRELKPGQPEPAGFIKADHDEETGKTVGWVPVGDGPEDAAHREAFAGLSWWPPGTYELLGPKVQGNPEHYAQHVLVGHADPFLRLTPEPPRAFGGLRAWLSGQDIEGVVWHHEDGRMAKIKKRDFGLERQP